ncbi:lipoyl(octanoyl) transferase LipB [Roseibium sp. MMSF_3544]|uniref:lipoyl(octanoyl) transferase LipB n=1 Tax=unclassified Roseibium TaxID=2629323 RepID=UPI00273E6E76|nr:lipoyl(octanoyl) transferase LipB [Roseibium sp. MMSF_3544]
MSPAERDQISLSFQPKTGSEPVEWKISDELVDYEHALEEMESRVERIISGEARELVWLLEHPPLYTAGTRADDRDLVTPDRFPVYRTKRGGQHTYHGPGQRIAYVMLNLKTRKQDVRAFVSALETWLINTLWHYHIRGERREDRVGVWVSRPDRGEAVEDKIAALGLRLRRWVTYHGISFNVEPELDHFSGIVPCGVKDHGVTSLVDLGIPVTMAENDMVLRAEFEKIFGPVVSV